MYISEYQYKDLYQNIYNYAFITEKKYKPLNICLTELLLVNLNLYKKVTK